MARLLMNPLHVLRRTTAASLRGDLIAGLTVGLVAVPQCMAFAEIAGLPPVVGLYSMAVTAVVGSLLSSTPSLSIGPANSLAILTIPVVNMAAAAAATDDPGLRVTYAAAMTLLSGLFQIGFGIARIGELVRYVSRSVVVGFSAGSGVLIAAKQIGNFLGIQAAERASVLPGLPGEIDELVRTPSALGYHAPVIGGLCLAVLLLCGRVSRRLPGYMIALLAGVVAVVAFGWTSGQLRLVGELPLSLPPLSLPPLDLELLRLLMVPALAVALVGMIQSYSIAKAMAARTGEAVDANQEFAALGVTNGVSGLLSGMPACGSFARSALNASAGATTQLAGAAGGLFTALGLVALAPVARYIPMAAIAAILFVIAWNLIDWSFIGRLRRSNPADFWVCVWTALATVLIPLEYAVFVGVFLNIALYLRRARQLCVTELSDAGLEAANAAVDADQPIPHQAVPAQGEPPRSFAEAEAPAETAGRLRPIRLLNLEGNLFFASADELQDRCNLLLREGTRVVILRLRRTHMVDATIMATLEQFIRSMHAEGRHVLLCGVRPRMHERMALFGLTRVLGEDNLFETGDATFGSVRAALQRARHLLSDNGPEASRVTAPPVQT